MDCAWETLRTFSYNHRQLQGSTVRRRLLPVIAPPVQCNGEDFAAS